MASKRSRPWNTTAYLNLVSLCHLAQRLLHPLHYIVQQFICWAANSCMFDANVPLCEARTTIVLLGSIQEACGCAHCRLLLRATYYAAMACCWEVQLARVSHCRLLLRATYCAAMACWCWRREIYLCWGEKLTPWCTRTVTSTCCDEICRLCLYWWVVVQCSVMACKYLSASWQLVKAVW